MFVSQTWYECENRVINYTWTEHGMNFVVMFVGQTWYECENCVVYNTWT